jgi:rare lipoprotein A
LLIIAGIAVFSAAQTTETFRQEGVASWYGKEFEGRPTASGELFNPALYTAAHPTLPHGTILTVTNKTNMRQVTVRINDRGPFVAARIIDLSKAAAEVLDMINAGTAPVILERAANTTLGPVAAPAIAAPSVAAPSTAEPTAPTAAAQNSSAPITTTVAASSPASEPVTDTIDKAPLVAEVKPEEAAAVQPVAVQPAAPPPLPLFFPAPPAVIMGVVPPAGSTKLYRLQVGAYKVQRNAVDAFEKLKKNGLNPAYEQSGEFYRVILAGLSAADIPLIAQTLGNSGFREALIREDIK